MNRSRHSRGSPKNWNTRSCSTVPPQLPTRSNASPSSGFSSSRLTAAINTGSRGNRSTRYSGRLMKRFDLTKVREVLDPVTKLVLTLMTRHLDNRVQVHCRKSLASASPARFSRRHSARRQRQGPRVGNRWRRGHVDDNLGQVDGDLGQREPLHSSDGSRRRVHSSEALFVRVSASLCFKIPSDAAH